MKRIVGHLRGRCLRVVKRPNIWVDCDFWYPEERQKWWPFWFRFEDACGGQIFFREESEAWDFLRRLFPQNAKIVHPATTNPKAPTTQEND
jgi:hypothetical protein